MRKLKVLIKKLKQPCYCCNESTCGKTTKRNECKFCGGTGQFVENYYYHIYTTKEGQQICFGGETLK
jgi:hypothetical protein